MPRTRTYGRHQEEITETYTHRLVIGERVILADPECGCWNLNGGRELARPIGWDDKKAERLEKPEVRRFYREIERCYR
jgi:hypothetical protein